MISLITGLPGSGKTSLMVYMLMTRKDLQNRPLYVDGIPDLKIPHQEIPEGCDMTTWYEWAPTGAILVIDEAQRIFRPRPAGAKVPQYVQELETHRHKGIDIFILTQHPRLIDVNLRALIGEHRNISKTMLGFKRVSYWQRCANPEARSDVAEAKNSIFFTKKAAFGMYKSAEEHTKLSGNISLWVYTLPLIIMITGYLMFYVNQRYEQKINPEETTAENTEPTSNPSQNVQDPPQGQYTMTQTSTASAASEPASPSRTAITEDDFKPDIEGRPWTAPAYDTFNRNYQAMPYPVACVKSSDSCTCYTDQATPIRGMDKKTCIDFAENGIYNPYLQTELPQNETVQAQPESAKPIPQVSQMAGQPLPSLSNGDSKDVANIQ